MSDEPEKFPPEGTLIRGWHNGQWAFGIVCSHRLVGDEWHFRCFWSDNGNCDDQFWSPVRFRSGWKSKMHPWEVLAFLLPLENLLMESGGRNR